MKKYIIILLTFLCFESKSQSASEFIDGIPIITLSSTWKLSNEFMRQLKMDDYPEIPSVLVSTWSESQIKFVDGQGTEYSKKARFFDECVKPIGKIQMREGYSVVLFCKFKDEGLQKFARLVAFSSSGEILSIKHCYAEVFEMMGFFLSGSNEVTVLKSGEEYVTKNVITLNSSGLFQTISFDKISGYQFE